MNKTTPGDQKSNLKKLMGLIPIEPINNADFKIKVNSNQRFLVSFLF